MLVRPAVHMGDIMQRLFAATLFVTATACGTPTEDTTVTEASPYPPVSIRIAQSPDALTQSAIEAVALAPSWLRQDLAFNLRQLSELRQHNLAEVMLTVEDPRYLDEIAFCLAHLSPEVLESPDFYPQLLVDNARGLYARDEALTYVAIDDVGNPGTDEDYYTTATYRVENEDGEIIERTIEREIWYWYVVHPRIEDEFPLFVNPWMSCNGLECAHTPESGVFWRDFLWDGAAQGCMLEGGDCPHLVDVMPSEIDVLWKNKSYNSDDNGAVGVIIGLIKSAMSFGAQGERSIQPNRIYGLSRGNCGEWADMTSALARTVLIPSHNVGAWGNDHTWNEFWDDGWKQWEPVNNYVLHYGYYMDGEGNSSSVPVYGVSATRGDALTWNRTEDYGVTFELNIRVVDTDGQPVDGAMVSLYGPITVYPERADDWWFIMESITDEEGRMKLLLGEKNLYAARVESQIGTFPIEANRIEVIVEESVANQSEEIEIVIDAQMPAQPAMSVSELPLSGDITLSINHTFDGSRLTSPSARLRGSATIEGSTAATGWVLDEAAYLAFLADEPFEAITTFTGTENLEVDVSSTSSTYVVISNRGKIATGLLGTLDVRAINEAWNYEPAQSSTYQLMAGEYLACEIAPMGH